MHVARHWRNQNTRYRLEGVRYQNGELSMKARPVQPAATTTTNERKDARQRREAEVA